MTAGRDNGDGLAKASVAFPSPLVPVELERRVNRFVVEVRDGYGQLLRLHLPNSGRMQELLPRGARGLSHLDPTPGRRTAGTLLLVHYNQRWVSVDARMPNRLFQRAWELGVLDPFRDYDELKAEVPWDEGRIDFLLTGPQGPGRQSCLVETKSCNLVEDGVALFPDAPTTRGTRHLAALTAHARQGHRAAVVWFVQRDDARLLRPHREADPDFAQALEKAMAAGVEALAYRCRVTPEAITPLAAIPVLH